MIEWIALAIALLALVRTYFIDKAVVRLFGELTTVLRKQGIKARYTQR